jgi:hypothetical protein
MRARGLRPRGVRSELAIYADGGAPQTRCPISRLNTRLALSPVNTSRPTSRSSAHDSGPKWIATPFSYKTSTCYSSPASRRSSGSGSGSVPTRPQETTAAGHRSPSAGSVTDQTVPGHYRFQGSGSDSDSDSDSGSDSGSGSVHRIERGISLRAGDLSTRKLGRDDMGGGPPDPG